MTDAAQWWAGAPDLLPPDPELDPLHQRDYQVRAWRIDDSSMLLRGAVMDRKPGSDFRRMIESAGGHDEGEPLVIHHMVVDLVVGFPQTEITDARVLFETYPQPGCPRISDRYRELIGLSIARGFTHEVRRLFGGPRGCTHTTALLQAMAPVAVQCFFSMRRSGPQASDAGSGAGAAAATGAFMRDTCHVWSSEGDLWQGITVGRRPPVALPMQARFQAGGVDPADAGYSGPGD